MTKSPRYIYADLNNGCIEVLSSAIEIDLVSCDNIEDARSYLDGLCRDQFEIALAVPETVFDAIDQEYGIY